MFDTEVRLQGSTGGLVHFADLTPPGEEAGSLLFRHHPQAFLHQVLVDHAVEVAHVLDQMICGRVFFLTNFAEILAIFEVSGEIVPEVVESVVSSQLSHLAEPLGAYLAAELLGGRSLLLSAQVGHQTRG